MKLNFEDEQESGSNDHIKIPQTDFFYNEQIKMDEIYNMKVSIKFIKILSTISILFCMIFTIFQIFQDYQFSTLQKQLNQLKIDIHQLKSNNIYNYNDKTLSDNNINKKEYIDNKNNDCIHDEPKINEFSAETIGLKEKFSKEIVYIKECMTDTKIKNFEKVEDPSISIIIPIYKTERYINRLIQSIQKQEVKEVELIFVEDFSEKKDFPKLTEISKIDKRITIIKNDKNSGKLNAYIQSILKAKSKYMMFLEEEEVLLPYLKDIFDLIATYNRDINNFSSLKGTLNGITFDEKIEDSEKTQPELSESYYNENFINENPLLNKIFKTEIIQNAIKNINEYYLTEKFDFHVDSLLYICFCTYAKSYKSFGNIYKEYHIKKEFSKSSENLEKMFDSTIYLSQFIYELKYDYEEVFNQRCLLVINLFNWPLNYNIKLHINVKKAVKVVNMFLNNKDINSENKRKIELVIRKIKDRAFYKK